MTTPKTSRLAVATSAGALLIGIACAAADVTAERYRTLIEEKAPSLVTVKFVLKMNTPWGDQEQENEITGVMIDPKGMVLCSNSQFGGMLGMFARGRDIQSTPTDIKVLIGDDTIGVDAKIIARDSELDLAWVQIEEPAEAGYACTDLTKSVEPKVGDPLTCVRRMGKYFDRAPAVLEGRVSSIVSKPRRLYVPSVTLAGAPGMPVYTEEGKLVGLMVMQMPDEEAGEFNPTSFASMQDMIGGLILPAERVVKATERAREIAKSEMEEDNADEESESEEEQETDTDSPESENG